MNIETVVIYSDADQNMPYVTSANEAVHIGPSPVAGSYLQIERIITTAKEAKADAIHPGYGLLSENATFARRCEEEGIIFIGPTADVIGLMGDKIDARNAMNEAGVPTVPGVGQAITSPEEAISLASSIGYPVMIKASAGGGGIGMQKVSNNEECERTFASLQGRAKAYFGNDTMFIEKFIENPHHIEVQVMGDEEGHVVHLFERECSVQRRHQKVIEESLSPFISEETRSKLCYDAIKAVQSVNYIGAGTVEFIMDDEQNYYFLEMNTRLQVEHPVTEGITGLDLVEWQIRIARGEALPLKQDQIKASGVAMEFRIYAEDPITFLPSPGLITKITFPEGEGLRVDTAIESNSVISPFYDPMIAKLIVCGSNRDEVLERSKRYLSLVTIEGIKTNIRTLLHTLEIEDFRKGKYTTLLLEKNKMSS